MLQYYAERNEDESLKWLYHDVAPGIAEEMVAYDAAEVVAFIQALESDPASVGRSFSLEQRMAWFRMTDAEADLVQEEIDLLPIRKKGVIATTSALSSASFPGIGTAPTQWFRDAVISALGQTRADAVLSWIMPLW